MRRRIPLMVTALALLVGACTGATTETTTGSTTPGEGTSDTSPGTSQATTDDTGETGAPIQGGSITIGYLQDPASFSPIDDVGQEKHSVLVHVVDRLVEVDQVGEIVPSLATEWENPDPLTWIFHLREGVQFSNGAPFSSSDVVYTFETIMSEDSAIRGTFDPFIDAVIAVDPMTVRFDLKKPFNDFLEEMGDRVSTGIMQEGFMDTCSTPRCDIDVIGTGPFMVDEFLDGDTLTLVRNPTYWGAPLPYLDEIVFKVIPDPQTQVLNIQSGDIDILWTPPLNDVETLAADPNLVVYEHGSGLLTEIGLNTASEPFNNPDVRRAVRLGVDTRTIVDTVLVGHGEVAESIFPTWHKDYDPAVGPGEEYNPDEAITLLADAGYGPDNPLSFTLKTTTEAFTPDMATLIQAQLADIGVDVTIQQDEKGAFYGSIFRGEGVDYTAWQAGMVVYFFGSGTALYAFDQWDPNSILNSVGVNLPDGYQDPVLGALVESGRASADPEELADLYVQISDQVRDGSFYEFIGYQNNVQVANKRVQDYGALTQQQYPLKYVWVTVE